MKILITGSSGYIGSVLTKMALEKGHNVRAVDRFFLETTFQNTKI